MKSNVQAHQRLKNRFLCQRNLPIFSLCFLFLMVLLLSSAKVYGSTHQDVKAIEKSSPSFMNNRNRIDSVAFICQGETFNNNVYSEHGFYSGWFILSEPSGDTVFYELTVYPVYSTLIDTSICEGNAYSFFDQNLTESGVYTHTIPSINGCDSTFVLHLTVNPAANPHIFGIPNNYSQTCGGELSPRCWTEEEQTDYQWTVVGGEIVAPFDPEENQVVNDSTWIIVRWNEEANPNASISINYKNSNGCSAITPTTYYFSVTMPIHEVVPTIYDTICEGDNYVQHGFNLYNLEAGVYDTTIEILLPITPSMPCGGDTIKSLHLIVISEPDVIIVPNDTTIYAQQEVTLCAEDLGFADTLATTFIWSWVNGGDTGTCITVAPMQNTTYTVRAINSIGCWDISISASVKVLTYFDNPENLQVTTADCHPILTWDAPDFPYGFGWHLGYVIYRDGEKIAQVMNNVLSYTDDRRDEGTYRYCVTALYTYPYNPSQVESEAVCFDYVSPIPEFFNPPLNVYAYPSYDCNVVVVWDAPENTCWGEVVGYNIYRNRGDVFETQWLNLPVSKLVFEDTDVHVKGQDYTYCVQAVYDNFSGVSDVNVACFTTNINCGLAVNVYPNPADDQISVVANNMDFIQVYDIIGRYITTIQVPREYCHEITFSTAQWESGTYLFKIHFIDDVMPEEVRRATIIHW